MRNPLPLECRGFLKNGLPGHGLYGGRRTGFYRYGSRTESHTKRSADTTEPNDGEVPQCKQDEHMGSIIEAMLMAGVIILIVLIAAITASIKK